MVIFINPEYLLLLIVLVPLVFVMRRKYVAQYRGLLRLYTAKYLHRMHIRYHTFTKIILTIVIVGVLISSLAGPHIVSIQEDTTQSTNTQVIYFLLDVSKSMYVQDQKPSRMQVAVDYIQKTVRNNPNTKYSLIVFTDVISQVVPPTKDRVFLFRILTIILNQSILNGSTDFKDILIYLYQNRTRYINTGDSRTLFLISDGESHTKTTQGILRPFRKQGIAIIVGAVGTETGGVVPSKNSSNMLKKSGVAIVSHANPSMLSAMASQSDGTFIHITKNALPIDIKNNTYQHVQDITWVCYLLIFVLMYVYLIVVLL